MVASASDRGSSPERKIKPAKKPAPADQQLTCVIVEDQGMFLEMLGGMLAMRGGLRVVGQARTVAGGKQLCSELEPDLLILDLTLTDGNGLAVAEAFRGANPAGKVIVVSGNASDFVCPAWLNDGLQAVIGKNETFQALRQELDELLGAVRPIAAQANRDLSSGTLLTPREAEVFALMGEGLSSREIASRLEISEHTVQTHRKRLAVKLGTQGSELTRIAITQRQNYFASAE
jgi:DNA-binding NarL/FixJ family response regulator